MQSLSVTCVEDLHNWQRSQALYVPRLTAFCVG